MTRRIVTTVTLTAAIVLASAPAQAIITWEW